MIEKTDDGKDLTWDAVNVGPGIYLKQIREEKNISFDEALKQLHFTPQRLMQLESDDYKTMGSSTFARGYIRVYARWLGLNSEEITQVLRLFDAQGLQSEIRTNKPRLIREDINHSKHRLARWFGYLLMLAVVVLIGFWWHGRTVTTTEQLSGASDPSALSVTVSQANAVPASNPPP